MWIRIQNEQMIINSDQLIDIFVDRSGTKIIAELTEHEGHLFTIAEYKDRDTCLKVLEAFFENTPYFNYVTLPLGGDVDEWIEALK